MSQTRLPIFELFARNIICDVLIGWSWWGDWQPQNYLRQDWLKLVGWLTAPQLSTSRLAEAGRVIDSPRTIYGNIGRSWSCNWQPQNYIRQDWLKLVVWLTAPELSTAGVAEAGRVIDSPRTVYGKIGWSRACDWQPRKLSTASINHNNTCPLPLIAFLANVSMRAHVFGTFAHTLLFRRPGHRNKHNTSKRVAAVAKRTRNRIRCCDGLSSSNAGLGPMFLTFPWETEII